MTADEDILWEDLRKDLQDPKFLRGYVTHWVRIATTDAIVNAFDDARLSKFDHVPPL